MSLQRESFDSVCTTGPHHITGNGVGFKPDILDMDVMEEVLMVTSEESVMMARQLALKEGLMVTFQRTLHKFLVYF